MLEGDRAGVGAREIPPSKISCYVWGDLDRGVSWLTFKWMTLAAVLITDSEGPAEEPSWTTSSRQRGQPTGRAAELGDSSRPGSICGWRPEDFPRAKLRSEGQKD